MQRLFQAHLATLDFNRGESTSVHYMGWTPNDDTSLYPYGPLENLINVGISVFGGIKGIGSVSPALPASRWPVIPFNYRWNNRRIIGNR